MRIAKFVFVLAFAGLSVASAAAAKDYDYTAPVSPAVSEALQTPAKAPDTYADLGKRANTTAIDTTPGLIRPATRIAEWTSHDDNHRGFACADAKCKTVTPVYNSRTPLEQEQSFLNDAH
jgi:hypothetical protein